ncbi:MFS transporter [Shewanella chilikensis]|jgi:predicted MFS family arabinose efflux permease|uniref:MFS transporter n=1 Tax=Shewanella chilikensis TaxID=558541 RepID=A0A6G7LPU3_9GAMM|nr:MULTISPECIES: MFS transporter [Shewanella]MCL1162074.1 MFS transporter [Shewanella chilikensis]QIJ03789.1 MFS transporter [Shewanella chilikensis]HCD14929.1 MFS transporter [Shewanella sp.]
MNRLLILALGMFSIGTASFVMAGLLPEMAASFNISVGDAASMIAAFAVAYALMLPIAATLMVNLPYKPILVVGMSILAVGHVVSALAPNLEAAIAGRALGGLGGALFMPIAGAAATAIVAQEHWGRSLAIITAGLSASTAIGAPVGIALSTSFGDWRLGMWLVAALAGAAAIGLGTLLAPIPKPDAKRMVGDLLASVAKPAVLGVLGTTLFLMIGSYIVHTYASVILMPATNGRGETLALLMAAWGVAATIGTFTAGRLTDRWGARPIIVGGLMVLSLNFLLLPVLTYSPFISVLPLAVWGGIAWSCLVPLQHQLVKAAPSSASIVLGLNTSAIYLGVSLSASIGKHVSQTFGSEYLSMVAAGFTILALGVYGRIQRIESRSSGKTTYC